MIQGSSIGPLSVGRAISLPSSQDRHVGRQTKGEKILSDHSALSDSKKFAWCRRRCCSVNVFYLPGAVLAHEPDLAVATLPQWHARFRPSLGDGRGDVRAQEVQHAAVG